jgi:uncharacterized Zn finger protein
MVRDHFLDFDGTIGHMWANGYRCMNCGNVHDPVIEQHRLTQKQQMLVVQHSEPDYQEVELLTEAQAVIMRAA